MRILVFFDLPIIETAENEYNDSAAKFRKNLIKDGYYMVQFCLLR